MAHPSGCGPAVIPRGGTVGSGVGPQYDKPDAAEEAVIPEGFPAVVR